MSLMLQLAEYPATWIAVTGLVYLLADGIYKRAGCFPLLNPVLIAVLLLIALLKLTGVSYASYFNGARPIHLLLGPATVALGIPLYLNLAKMKQYFIPLSIALLVGSLVGIVSILLIGPAVGLSWLIHPKPLWCIWVSRKLDILQNSLLVMAEQKTPSLPLSSVLLPPGKESLPENLQSLPN